MLKCAWYGCRSVSSSAEGFFGNATATTCGPALTGMRDVEMLVNCLMILALRRRLHREQSGPLAVEHQIHFVGFA